MNLSDWLIDDEGCIRDEHAKAYWAGYRAFFAGFIVSGNESDAWIAGWREAFDYMEKEGKG